MSRFHRSQRRPAVLLALAVAAVGVGVTQWCVSRTDFAGVGESAVVAAPAPAGASARQADAREPAAAARGCYAAAPGARFVHRIDDRAEYRVLTDRTAPQSAGQLHSESRLVTTVLARREGELLVEYRLDGVAFLAADGQPIVDDVQRSFAAAAQTPVQARLDANGRVLGYGFAAGLDGDQRNFLRGMLATVAFAAPAGEATTWTADEADASGEFEARYEVLPAAKADDVAVRRTKLRYKQLAGHAETPAHELHGASSARFDTAMGWLTAATIAEDLTFALPLLDLRTATERRATVELESCEHVDVPVDLAAAWRAADAPVSGRFEAVGKFAQAAERRRHAELLKGVTADQVLAELRALLAQQPLDQEKLDGAFQRLQWLAKLDDAVARELGERVRTQDLRGDLAGIALSALGAAGTPAAEALLVEVRSDRSLACDVRVAATTATLQLERPSGALVQGLAADAATDFDGRQNAMLVLGALGPRAEQPLADGRSPVAALLAMEGDAVARGDTATWLLAVGNAAPPETCTIVARYLDDANPDVRAAAVAALRRVGNGGALSLLVDRGATDADARVRREAVLALARRPEAAAREALQQIASNDPDESLRARAGELLRSRA